MAPFPRPPAPPGADKRSLICECTAREPLAPGVVRLEFPWAGPAPGAGQFFLLRPERTGVFLARPFSAASWRPAGDPAAGGGLLLSFLAAPRGRGSAELAGLRPGERAELTGPLGNRWRDASGAPAGTAALVSGGVGIAPLAALAQELEARSFDFYAGFRDDPYGLGDIKARTLVVAAENGSGGLRGRIPDYFSPKGYAVVYACGPLPMLKALGLSCRAAGVPCYVGMEKHMACGVGACLGCTIETGNGNRRCCADGPVFNAEDLNLG